MDDDEPMFLDHQNEVENVHHAKGGKGDEGN